MVIKSVAKKALIACIFVYLLCPLAFAKDNFSGPYLGAHFGGAQLNNTIIDSHGYSNHPKGYEFNYDDSNLIGGFVGGYNWRFNNWVTGLEADFNFGQIDASSDKFDELEFDEIVKSTHNWSSTLRGRVGYVFDNVFPYITGGLAVANITNKLTDYDVGSVDPSDSYSSTENQIGWVVGAGAEMEISESWGLRLEGLHMNYGRVDNSTGANTASFGQRNKMNTVRVGLIYFF